MNYLALEKIIKDLPNFRRQQIFHAVLVELIDNWQQASSLPKQLRDDLQQQFSLDINYKLYPSADNKTIKAVINLSDNKVIESVLMLQKDRTTVCVSSQVGCPMKCAFCATGKMGFYRNLHYWEIVEQVLLFERLLKKDQRKVSNIVFMGMGEPFLNYDNVMKATNFFNDHKCFNIGARKISISTCGNIQGIRKLAKEKLQLNLAFSMHAPSDAIRQIIMPQAASVSLEEILRTLKYYIQITNRKVMIEYIMLDKINDTELHARSLVQILKKYLDPLFMVNLIVYNKTLDKYKPSKPENIEKFIKILKKNKIEVTQRFKQGREIKGACGQLASDEILYS